MGTRQGLRSLVRTNARLVTGLLTTVSLALIVGAVRGVVPASALPHVEVLVASVPHANAVISAAAITTILVGIRAIRRGRIARHQRAMLGSTALFGLFLLLYLYRIVLEGPTVFDGPQLVRRFLYLPLLAVHILLAMVCLPFVYHALVLATTHSVEDLPETIHPHVGRIGATLWLVSFTLGIAVYLMLYGLF